MSEGIGCRNFTLPCNVTERRKSPESETVYGLMSLSRGTHLGSSRSSERSGAGWARCTAPTATALYAQSPDGKHAMYTIAEQFVSDLMLVDGFH